MVHHNDDADGDGRTISQFHFKAWPDRGVPQDSGAVLGFIQDINRKKEALADDGHEQGPIIVHGSAGVGRTGTFIVMDILLNLINYQGMNTSSVLNIAQTG